MFLKRFCLHLCVTCLCIDTCFREGPCCVWRLVVDRSYGGKLLVQRPLSADVTILAGNLLCSGGIYIHTASVPCVVRRILRKIM